MWQQTSLYMFPCAHVQKPHLEVYLSMKILNDSVHLQVYWIITIFQCIVLPEMGKTPIAPHSHQNYHQTVKYFIVLLIFISLIIMRLITFSYYNSHLHFLSCEMLLMCISHYFCLVICCTHIDSQEYSVFWILLGLQFCFGI